MGVSVCSELGVLGACPTLRSLKSWSIRSWGKLFTPQGEAGNCGFPPIVLRVGFIVKVCLNLSYPFNCGYILIHSVYRSHSGSSWISDSKNFSMCSCRFSVTFVGGGEFRNLLHHQLGLDSYFFFLLNLLFCTFLSQSSKFLLSCYFFHNPIQIIK